MIACESFFKFTLPDGSRPHEDVNPNSSPGVDFEVAGDPPMWIQVKNWESPTIPVSYREAKREAFAREIERGEFWSGIVRKFEGTHACLTERGERPATPTLLLLLHCDLYTRGQVAPDTSILERLVARSGTVSDGVSAVLPFAALRDFVEGAEAMACSLLGRRTHVCEMPVPHCSLDRQKHR